MILLSTQDSPEGTDGDLRKDVWQPAGLGITLLRPRRHPWPSALAETANTQRSRVNTALPYHLSSLRMVRLHIGQGIDTVEVRSSSLIVPAISFNSLRAAPKSLASRPHKIKGSAQNNASKRLFGLGGGSQPFRAAKHGTAVNALA